MEYPKFKESWAATTYMSFLILKPTKPEAVDDTVIVYDEHGLMINVDIDKAGVPCGVEILYHGEEK